MPCHNEGGRAFGFSCLIEFCTITQVCISHRQDQRCAFHARRVSTQVTMARQTAFPVHRAQPHATNARCQRLAVCAHLVTAFITMLFLETLDQTQGMDPTIFTRVLVALTACTRTGQVSKNAFVVQRIPTHPPGLPCPSIVVSASQAEQALVAAHVSTVKEALSRARTRQTPVHCVRQERLRR